MGITELTDVLTTAMDRAQGAIEGMPVSAAILAEGGVLRLALLKILLVVALAIAWRLTVAWAQRDPSGVMPYRFVCNGCRIATVAIALVSFHNAVLYTTL